MTLRTPKPEPVEVKIRPTVPLPSASTTPLREAQRKEPGRHVASSPSIFKKSTPKKEISEHTIPLRTAKSEPAEARFDPTASAATPVTPVRRTPRRASARDTSTPPPANPTSRKRTPKKEISSPRDLSSAGPSSEPLLTSVSDGGHLCMSDLYPALPKIESLASPQYKLKDYQDEDLEKLVRFEQRAGTLDGQKTDWQSLCKGFIIAYVMGLGKTVLMIALLCETRRFHIGGTTIVVCPGAGIMMQWRDEIQKFAPHLKAFIYHSTNKSQFPSYAKKLSDIHVEFLKEHDVVIVSYDQLQRQFNAKSEYEAEDSDKPLKPSTWPLLEISWLRSILDEAHTIRNPDSKSSAGCLGLKTRYAYGLTATPIQNYISDLFPLFQMINVTYADLNVRGSFDSKVTRPMKDTPKIVPAVLQMALDTCQIYRGEFNSDKTPLIELPPKIVHTHAIDLSRDERALLTHVKKLNISPYANITRQRQAVIDPFLLTCALKNEKGLNDKDSGKDGFLQDDETPVADKSDEKPDLESSPSVDMKKFPESIRHLEHLFDRSYVSTKLKKAISILNAIMVNRFGDKTIVLSRFVHPLDVIANGLEEKGVGYRFYRGDMSAGQRTAALADLRDKSNCDVCLMTMQTGSLGLNITQCNNVIILDPWWNPFVEEQAIGRVRRIGQTKECHVYKILASDTIDDTIVEVSRYCCSSCIQSLHLISMSSLKHDALDSEPKLPNDQSWIAIQPLSQQAGSYPPLEELLRPPSFQSSRFDIVLRRQHQRPKDGGGLKNPAVPSRFLNLSNAFEFSGWGVLSHIDLNAEDTKKGEDDIQVARRDKSLGQFTAAALAGNAVLGSVFYALPAVVVVANVYSPISLFIATMIMFLWRPIMEELASALPFGGAPYTYLLNVSSKWIALVGAAVLLLDFASTAVVSAATAATYLGGEVHLSFPVYVVTLLVLIVFACICLSGLRESARLALMLLTLHIITMTAIFIVSIVAWARAGNSQLKDNWTTGRSLTGFECLPSYVSNFKPGIFPLVLRNLHYPAIFMNVLSMLFLLALVPFETILQGNNVLSVLAEVAAGKWMRIWLVVDAVVVLCGGVLTGVLGVCELAERLARDRLLPQAFLRRLGTGAPIVSIMSFLVFNIIIYASSGFNLVIISKMFSFVWLIVMTLFPLSVLLLKFNRGRLPRDRRVPISVVFLTFGVVFTAIGGNIAIDPTIVGYAAAYFLAIVAIFYATMRKVSIVRSMFWLYDQSPMLHIAPGTKSWGDMMTAAVKQMRRQSVCLLINTDEINRLFHKVLYVKQNEETSCIKLVHFYEVDEGIPSEMEANWRILDEAFPEITVDLVLVRGEFTPARVAALSHRLQIPTTLMFLSCPGPDFPYAATDFGARIISL
ncbi:hypothetical protein EUX98_g2455 [Antrodiella citrinella]|uniref:Helicase C-terminal domain-containing protein n=1 Tax=Antrodiella citrinella TaxID=2447956 RepID=A0A4V3XJ52_9APHY|nr:hypothetical protein EUX98_g2455 [Antrodiella citrinella]